MPSPGTPVPTRLSVEDSYLELLVNTLEGLDISARGLFLQRYFHSITRLDFSENQSLQLWDDVFARRRQLSENLGRPVAWKTALMDVLAAANLFRLPIVIEYDELRRLELNAATDPLTGLYNRRFFNEALEKELNRARRYNLPLALVMLDLHRFKEVNDKYGHPRGDEVLSAAAVTLRKALRTSDTAFRIGGDEFALLLPQTDATQSLALSRRVETVFLEILQPLQLAVSVSMDHGVANFPQDGEQADQLIRIADERLYTLKHGNHGKSGKAEARATTVPESASPPVSSAASTHSEPISIDSARTQEKTGSSMSETTPVNGSEGQSSLKPEPHEYAIQRKAERVSMAGTNAYALLGDQGTQRARVLDLGFGGVALEWEGTEELPESMFAVLHVPILPPVRVNLKPVWSRRTAQGVHRVGCAFVS